MARPTAQLGEDRERERLGTEELIGRQAVIFVRFGGLRGEPCVDDGVGVNEQPRECDSDQSSGERHGG
jgi:hypothetical protein